MSPAAPGSLLPEPPCLDSDEMAESRRRELDVPRSVAITLGESAVAAATAGHYLFAGARRVDWSREVAAARSAGVSLPPEAPCPPLHRLSTTRRGSRLTNETTFLAARRLVDAGFRPLALNFANGIHPGGGFLHGSRARRRSSAGRAPSTSRSKAIRCTARERPRPDSTDWAILSPDVPVFRSDDGTGLEQPWLLSFLTCAAPVAHHVGQPESGDLLERRIHRALAIARAYAYSTLVLGAWGCGAFNDPHRTARDFRQALETHFRGAFSDVVFAISDWSPERKPWAPSATPSHPQARSRRRELGTHCGQAEVPPARPRQTPLCVPSQW